MEARNIRHDMAFVVIYRFALAFLKFLSKTQQKKEDDSTI